MRLLKNISLFHLLVRQSYADFPLAGVSLAEIDFADFFQILLLPGYKYPSILTTTHFSVVQTGHVAASQFDRSYNHDACGCLIHAIAGCDPRSNLLVTANMFVGFLPIVFLSS